MASRFSMAAVFKAVDQFTQPLSKMAKKNKRFTQVIKRDFAKAQRKVLSLASSIKTKLVSAMKYAAIIGIGALVAGLALATREFIKFDHAITSSSAKFKDLNLKTEAGKKTLLELKKTARNVGALTQFSATEAAGGLDFLAMAGFSSKQAMVSLLPTVDLATVANVDLARATDIASDSLGAFGLMTENTNQLQKNFTRLNDVMAKTMTSTNTNMEDMFEAIKKGAPTFTASGQTLESFNSLLGIMASSGVKGGEAGTQLRNIMLRLAKPTGEAAKVLKSLGIRTQDSKGNFLDIIDILGQFEKSTKKMGTAQKAAALKTIFGARSITGVNILLKSGTKNMRDFREQLINSGGSAEEMANIMRRSLQNRIKILQSSLIELGFKFVEAFEEKGSDLLEKLTKYIQQFDPTPIIEGIKKFINVTSFVLKILWRLRPIIFALIGALFAYKLTMIIAAVATTLFGATLNALPIFAIITAITLLIMAIAYMITHWEKVSKVITETWDKYKGIIYLFMPPLVIMIELIRAIFKHWNAIKEAFKSKGMLGGILAIGKALLDGVLAPLQSLLELIGKIPGIGKPFKGMAKGIGNFREGLFDNKAESPITPVERSTLTREESISKGELTIKDTTGKATMKKPDFNNFNIKMVKSGAF